MEFRAAENGFGGLADSIKIERTDELHYDISSADFRSKIDLTVVNNTAAVLQRTELWVLPREARTLSRIAVFTVQRIKDGQREKREQEFFRNAGLV